MSKYFCPDCNQAIDDVVCPVCGSPAESLSFDEGSPDGKNDRYDDSILAKVSDPDVDPDDEDVEALPEEEKDDEAAE